MGVSSGLLFASRRAVVAAAFSSRAWSNGRRGTLQLFHSPSRRKESEVSTSFFYFPSLCSLTSRPHLLYIFSDAEALSFRSRRRRFHRMSQRHPYCFLGLACSRRSLWRFNCISVQLLVRRSVRIFRRRTSRHRRGRGTFPVEKFGACCGAGSFR